MFEDIFGAHLKEVLEVELKERLNKDTVEIYMSQNNQYRPLENDSEAISVVVKTGNASKSHVPGYDLNTLPLIITFTVWELRVKVLLEALTAISNRENASFGDIDVNGETTKYKVIFNTPYAGGPAQSLRSVVQGRQATIKAVNVIWLLNITYSTNALLSPPKYKLKVDDKVYDIDFWTNFSASNTPAYDGNLISGARFVKQDMLSMNMNYAFILYKVADGVSALQDLFMADLEDGLTLSQAVLTLIKVTAEGEKLIPISTYNVNYQFESTGAVLTLTLGR